MRLRPEGWLLVLLPLVAAAEAPREEIVLRADRATIEQEKGTALYEGNAEMTQGARHLTAERIRVRLDNGEIRELEAEGEPVRLREGEELNGHARRVVYDVADRQVRLYEEAFVSHQGRTFEGAEVIYELESRQVRASGDQSGRVRMVIPEQDSDGKDDN